MKIENVCTIADLIFFCSIFLTDIFDACLYSPAHVMPLLEIVRTKKTSPQIVVDLLDIGRKIRKTPVVVGNCTGFAVNRMFFP
jgi:enoyl-CoA hydratase/3-hydroxyacyl-CoA dehydrogenase